MVPRANISIRYINCSVTVFQQTANLRTSISWDINKTSDTCTHWHVTHSVHYTQCVLQLQWYISPVNTLLTFFPQPLISITNIMLTFTCFRCDMFLMLCLDLLIKTGIEDVLGGMSPVMKFSWSRSSTVRRSIATGTNSKPVLEQRMARDGERLWHMQRFGQGCPLHTATSSSKDNHSRSIILHMERGNWREKTKRNEQWVQRHHSIQGNCQEASHQSVSLNSRQTWSVTKTTHCSNMWTRTDVWSLLRMIRMFVLLFSARPSCYLLHWCHK